MRALTLAATGGLQHLRPAEMPAPALARPDDVRVRVSAAALNHLDVWMARGLPGLPREFPHILGSDGAGVVESVGPAVRGWVPGARVMLNPGVACGRCEWCRDGEQPLCPDYGILGEHRHGTLAEFVVVPARNLAPVPEGWGWPEAAAFPLSTLTAWRMLVTRAALRPGETVLIWGIGGGVALAALAVAKLAGARVVVTSGSVAKLARAAELGADLVLDHGSADVPREVRGFTGGRGADVVVDSVGEATWERSLKALARRGRLVTCGGTSGARVVTDVRKLFWHQWTILGATMGNDAEFARVAGLAREGKLAPVIDRTYPLAEAPAAFERMAQGRQLGKIVIEVSHG